MISRFGTGSADPARVFTRGVLRWEFDADTGAMIARNHTEPTTSPVHPQFFFRLSGAKWQVCVRFPSGATQVIATEP